MNFEFATATRIVFGAGALQQVGLSVKHLGRALVVTGANPRRAEKLLANLAGHGVGATMFAVAGEPEIGTVEKGVALAKTGALRFGDQLRRRQCD